MEEQQQYNHSWTEGAEASEQARESARHEEPPLGYAAFPMDGTLTGPAALHQAVAAVEYAAMHGATMNAAASMENGTHPIAPSENSNNNKCEANHIKVLASPQSTTDDSSFSRQKQSPSQDGASRKRKLCQFPGCTKVVKSQNHCQAHGARAKRCSVEGCDKQAQTTHEGMCKRHWRIKNFPDNPRPADPNEEQQPKSVYETILPQSIAFRPIAAAKAQSATDPNPTEAAVAQNSDPLDPAPAPEGAIVMPLVAFLQEGASKPFGWHRNEEREVRGLLPVTNVFDELEDWERQLAVVEILLLGGGTPYASFKNLAHGWGRSKGFHTALIADVCEQRGEIIRKRKIEFELANNADAKQAATASDDDDDKKDDSEQQPQDDQKPPAQDQPPPYRAPDPPETGMLPTPQYSSDTN